MTKIGEITQRVIDLLQLEIDAGTPIFMGKSIIAHMIQSHPDDEFVKVAVRVSHGGLHYARTIYARDIKKMERFVKKGYLIKY